VSHVLSLLAVVALIGSVGPAISSTDAQESSLTTPAASVATPLDKILQVREANQILVPVSQVTAAYSLDPLIAEAQVAEHQLNIWGRAPGRAVIVLVHADFSASSIQVTVTQAPPILPEGVWSGLDANNNSKGFYEVRLSSDPMQFSDMFDYRPGRLELHFNNAIVPGRNLPGTSTTWFPDTYLRFRGDTSQLTLLDEDVESSPISVSSTLVRGIHFAAGGLTIHAGYTSVAGFQALFLPANKQSIIGATFTHHLNADSQVGLTSYFIQRDPTALDHLTARNVETLFFKRLVPQDTCNHRMVGCLASDLSVEVGISKRIGGAFSLAHHGKADEFHIAARYRPRHYAVSETDNLNGLQSDTRWDHVWSERLVSSLSGSDNRILTGASALATEVGTGNLQYRFSNGISLSSGMSASRFSDNNSLFQDVRRFAVPIIVSYDRARFGMSAQYEYSTTSHAFSSGQGYRGSIRWSGPRFQLSANAGLDTQALGIDSVFSAFPQLNEVLAQLGLGAATNIEELASLLNNRAFLNSLGLAPNATLQLVPRDWHAGLNLSWRRPRQTIEVSSYYNLNSFLTQSDTTVLNSVSYRHAISNSSELVGSFTLLDSVAPVRRLDPIVEFSLRHQFGNSPLPQWKQHNGIISGTVSVRDNSGTRPLQSAEITLDGSRRTASDGQGRYNFSKVPTGDHLVQITFKSSQPFWYTTPSKVRTAADSVVDFGIIYPSAQVVGYALNDAGIGLPNIGVSVKGPQGQINLTTDQAGKFVAPVAQTGPYVIRLNAETVPDGYALEALQPAIISVGLGELKKVSFTLPAIRTLTGLVQRYDPAKGKYVPVTGVTVQLSELNRQATTNSAGRYLFRDMPSGLFTVVVNDRQYCQVQLSAAPQILRQDINLPPGALTEAVR
jgi:hypothetical protein